MFSIRALIFMFALGLAACGQAGAPDDAPRLEAPAPETQPSRVFAPGNDAARAATGELTLTTTLRLPDAAQPGADALEVLTMRGANGIVVETQISSAVSPATQVDGQTLRALLGLPVEEPQVLVYRVAQEGKGRGGRGICDSNAAAFVLVWEPSGPGDALKVLPLSGGAPGAAQSRACPLLEYARK
jgi:hypothetical protein